MSDEPFGSSKRALDPIDRTSEVLFGLIMVLTFTGSLSVAEAGRAEVRTMLLGALGCNLAWGVIDAVFYLMGCLADTAGKLKVLHTVRGNAEPEEARAALAGALPPMVASVLQPAELEAVRLRIKALPEPPEWGFLRKSDWLGALGVFLLVFLSTFPVVVPFIFLRDVTLALRVSNAVAIVLLFLTGCAFGRAAGRRPVLAGMVMVVLGAVLVSLTIALGG